MTSGRQTFLVSILLLIAAGLQGRVAHAIVINHAQPDFILIVASCASILIGGEYAVIIGFLAGLLQASLIDQYVGSFLTSRTLAATFTGTLKRLVIRDSLLVPPITVFITTVVSELLMAAMAPSIWLHNIRYWGRCCLGEIIYNVILSYPVYYLMRKLSVGYLKEDPFGRIL